MLLSTRLKLDRFGKQLAEQLADNITSMDTGQYLPTSQRAAMAATVKHEINGNEFRLVAGKYVWTYELGRGPTLNDGDGAVRRYVREYVEETGMEPKGQDKYGMPIDKATLAYFISAKIHRSGTRPWREKQPTGVLSSVLNDKTIQQLEVMITQSYTAELAGFLLKAVA